MQKTDYKIGGSVSTVVEDSSLLVCNVVSLAAEFPMLQKNEVSSPTGPHVTSLLKVGKYPPSDKLSHPRRSV